MKVEVQERFDSGQAEVRTLRRWRLLNVVLMWMSLARRARLTDFFRSSAGPPQTSSGSVTISTSDGPLKANASLSA